MKKLIFLLVFIPILLIGQNFEPIQHKFIVTAIKQDSIYLSSDSAYFEQTKFIKGNHWNSSPRLEKAVGYTQKDISSGHIIGGKHSIADSTLLHIKINEENLPHYWTHCQGEDKVNARGIEYSPILNINPN